MTIPDLQTKEEVMEYARNLEMKEFHAYMAGEMWERRRVQAEQQEAISGLPCKDWHEPLLKWLTGLVLLVGGAAISLVVMMIVKHVV